MQSTHFRFQISDQARGQRSALHASTSPGLKLDPAQTHQLQLYHQKHRRYQVMVSGYIVIWYTSDLRTLNDLIDFLVFESQESLANLLADG